MVSPTNNLFLRLHKWASRQDENFLTESLAVVLEHLLVLAPEVGTRLVARLTGGLIDLAPEDASAIEIQSVFLDECGVDRTRLVLLTRYPEVFQPEDARPDLEIRWFEVADWLETELPAAEAASEIAGFLVRQLLDFLGARRMTLAQVGKYMPEGLRAL